MKRTVIRSYAKINLSLDVKGKREDGYHEVEMIMQQIELHDDVLVRFIPYQKRGDKGQATRGEMKFQDIELATNRSYLPKDERNLAYKAAQLMSERYGNREDLRGGKIRIDIKKRIPVGAGLAGGSSNGAAVLLALNDLWELNMSLEQLCAIGAELGSDVPFCLLGQAKGNRWTSRDMSKEPLAAHCALATGTGTELKPVGGLRAFVVLCKPPLSVSTAKVYGGIGEAIERHNPARPDTAELIEALQQGDLRSVARNMINILELYTLHEVPVVAEIKKELASSEGVLAAMMSGSGPTVFGIFEKREDAQRAFDALHPRYKETYITSTADYLQ